MLGHICSSIRGGGVCVHGHIYGPHTHFDLNQVGEVGITL